MGMPMKRECTKSSLNSLERMLTKSSPKDAKNSPLSHPVVELPQPLEPLQPVVLLTPQLLRKRKQNHLRAKTKIWDSVFSTKTDTTHTVYVTSLLSVLLKRITVKSNRTP